jgi:hypothetical protein
MLTGNLSTRPFYNDRLAGLVIALLAILVVALTGYNGWKLATLSSERGALKARIARDEGEAARLNAAAAATDRAIGSKTLGALAVSAHEANELIDQRTFSWTTFLGLIERTLPIDMRLVMVTPRVERGVFHVTMTVVAKDMADVDAFCEALGDTGRFYDVAPNDQHPMEDGSVAATIDASYLSGLPGPADTPGPSDAPGASGTPAPSAPVPAAGRPPRG